MPSGCETHSSISCHNNQPLHPPSPSPPLTHIINPLLPVTTISHQAHINRFSESCEVSIFGLSRSLLAGSRDVMPLGGAVLSDV
ncbi:hypothetical protein DMENIID0001_157340 [Sergentomyia squamirostris]